MVIKKPTTLVGFFICMHLHILFLLNSNVEKLFLYVCCAKPDYEYDFKQKQTHPTTSEYLV